jgi:hypothetical protein
MGSLKKLLAVIGGSTPLKVVAGFLPGVVAGMVIMILGLILLAPEPNVPPPYRDDDPGDVTIQISQSYLSAMAAQNLTGLGIPTPFGAFPLRDVRVQPQSGDQLLVTGGIDFPITGSRQVLVDLHPCVASSGRPTFVVTRVLLGGQPITALVGPSIQEKVNSSFKNFNLSIPHEHLSRIQTTSTALILIYASGSGGGQPAC